MAGEVAVRWDELVQRLRGGDTAAEEELCVFFYPRVVTFALLRLHDADRAREVAQETMLALLPALRNGRLRDPEKLPAFVHGTARNLINKERQSRAADRHLMPLEEDPALPGPAAEILQAAAEERQRALRLILSALEPLDRKILLLTLSEGMHPREIAPVVGLSAEVVRTRKTRAIQRVLERAKEMTRNPRNRHT